ncbi:MAG: hypothetical protein MUE53_07465, partial [Chitinophagales bacterium]|nr:hypothetical protein [Chitinophagales bacterium]
MNKSLQTSSLLPYTGNNKTKNFRLSSLFISLGILIGLSSSIHAQVSGTMTVPSALYPTLKDAIDTLNNQGVSGAVVVSVTAGNAQTAPTNGYQLNSTTLINSLNLIGNSITFNGNGNTISPYTGTKTITSTILATGNYDAIWVLSGVDNISINGFVFSEPASTAAAASMESAIAMFPKNAVAPFDACQNINITNCTFELSTTNNYTFPVSATNYIYGSTTALNLHAGTVASDVFRNINISNKWG